MSSNGVNTMAKECPGSRIIKDPTPEEIVCPFCLTVVEIWSDESEVDCINCGQALIKEITQSCLDWCPKAQECVGKERFAKYIETKREKRISG